MRARILVALTFVALAGGCVKEVTAVDVGRDHLCAIRAGTPYCWGRNDGDQVGDGSGYFQGQPTRVAALARVVDVRVGDGHSCALAADGDVYCWGRNFMGQSGGATREDVVVPTRVALDGRAAGIAAGAAASCAYMETGDLYCWGARPAGRHSGTPARVEGVEGVRDVAIETGRMCAVSGSGQVWCAVVGELNGAPTPIAELDDALAVAIGSAHACALRADGRVTCWGRNDYGQRGDAEQTEEKRMVDVPGIEDAVALSVGVNHSCAALTSGEVACWGSNSNGQLGRGDPPGDVGPPGVVRGLPLASAVSAGGDRSCAVTRDHALWCWGKSWEAQRADLSMPEDLLAPTRVQAFGEGDPRGLHKRR
ncbi:MAG: hypothetical protein KC468_31215 [Myxococcales bacterium]|nr:hypothetical protein [Myxococcales bacterium]